MKKLLLLFSALTSISSAYSKVEIYESNFLNESKFHSYLKSPESSLKEADTSKIQSSKILPVKNNYRSSVKTRRSSQLNKSIQGIKDRSSFLSRKNYLFSQKVSPIKTIIKKVQKLSSSKTAFVKTQNTLNHSQMNKKSLIIAAQAKILNNSKIKVSPVAPKVIAPMASSITTFSSAPVIPTAAPIRSFVAPISPITIVSASVATPTAPKMIPAAIVTPTVTPVARPLTPTPSPVIPILTPVHSFSAPITFPTFVPTGKVATATPTAAIVTPTVTPVTRPLPSTPTATKATPAAATATPTATGIPIPPPVPTGTRTKATPAVATATPTAAKATPTAAKATPTAAKATPTAAKATPTATTGIPIPPPMPTGTRTKATPAVATATPTAAKATPAAATATPTATTGIPIPPPMPTAGTRTKATPAAATATPTATTGIPTPPPVAPVRPAILSGLKSAISTGLKGLKAIININKKPDLALHEALKVKEDLKPVSDRKLFKPEPALNEHGQLLKGIQAGITLKKVIPLKREAKAEIFNAFGKIAADKEFEHKKVFENNFTPHENDPNLFEEVIRKTRLAKEEKERLEREAIIEKARIQAEQRNADSQFEEKRKAATFFMREKAKASASASVGEESLLDQIAKGKVLKKTQPKIDDQPIINTDSNVSLVTKMAQLRQSQRLDEDLDEDEDEDDYFDNH